jgi:hypothetical protein
MKCEHENCTRGATIKNQQYHPDKWLCTYHANKAKVEGRRKRKYEKLGAVVSSCKMSLPHGADAENVG